MKNITSYTMIYDLDKMTEKHCKIFTRVNLAFATLKNNRLIIKDKEYMKYLDQIREYNPNLEIVLSIGGAGAFGFSDMAMEKSNRDIFLNSMIEMINKYDLDGIDLDWEFPTQDWGGDFSPKDKENFTILIKEMRESLDLLSQENDKKYLLTIAAAVGEWFTNSTEMGEVYKYLDEIMLMTYDLRGFGQEITGHHTTLFSKKDDVFKTSNVVDGIKILEKEGVPKEMISIGAAMYSRGWDGVGKENHGLLQKANPGGNISLEYPKLLHEVIENEEYEVFFDDEAKVPWAYSKNKKEFVSFDNKESVKYKCKYVKNNNLKGIMFWRYCDWSENDLIDAMYEEFNE